MFVNLAGRRLEVSATANLHKVDALGTTRQGIHGGLRFRSSGPPERKSGPGQNSKFVSGVSEFIRLHLQDCQATLDYTVTYQLRAYFGGAYGAGPSLRVHWQQECLSRCK